MTTSGLNDSIVTVFGSSMVKQFTRNLVASMLLGPVTAVIVISYANLIYAGFPTAITARGIGFALFGSVLFNFICAHFSSLPGIAIYPQDNPAVSLGLVTASILGVGRPQHRLKTCLRRLWQPPLHHHY